MRNQPFSAFARELEKQDRKLALAFLEAVADIRSVSQIRALEAAIARRDYNAVFEALRLGTEFWSPLDAGIETAFRAGAIWQMAQVPKKAGPEGLTLIVRFNQRNPRAEQWVRNRSAQLITEIDNDQRQAVREVIEIGTALGRGSMQVALDITGRMQGNQRKGGIIGLHSRDAVAVMRMKQELADPGTASGYFQRAARDKRFDRTVAKAIREERALSSPDIDKITRRYADILLRKRGERVARTEAHGAFSSGRFEAVTQMIESGEVPANAVTLKWQATPSRRTRDTHAAMHNQEVAYGQPFTSFSGARMMYPGDTSLGAPGSETINCRCGAIPNVDYVKVARARGSL